MSTTSVTETLTDRLARRQRWTRRALVTNVVAQGVLVVTGGAVRLTGSGLGCSTWPQCEPGAFTPALHQANSIHPFIEFGNRTLTGFLTVIALTVAMLVWTDRSRSRSYRLLGLAPIVGVAVQAVIGGVTVLFHLNPAVVGVHMLVSLGLVAVSTVLVVRERAGDGHAVPVVGPRIVRLARVLTAVAVALLALGVIVTGSGPHGGDDKVAYRFAVDPVLIARAHAGVVWLFVLVLTLTLVALYRTTAPRPVRTAGFRLLAVTLLQGVIGYVQYFTGLPVVLVGLHMLGAVLLTLALAWFLLSLRTRDLSAPGTAAG
ncbi:MAG: COX15/CtaA family protein [Cellulomonas sp.]